MHQPGCTPSPVSTERTWQTAQGVLATGLWTVSQGAFHYPEGVFPLMARSAGGCRLVDTSGQEYVDWIMGWGPVLLGHADPRVREAIVAQLDQGVLMSLLTPLEVEVAVRIRAMVPCAEKVAFGKNGSDVLSAAVRVARAKTGRSGLLIHGYHGFHDWYMASVAECEGIPDSLRPLVRPFAYNDLAGLRDLFARFGDRIAAVVMEPCNVTLPAPGFLEGVRKLCDQNESLLIFDEIITSFRLARGGAQERFRVIPDLACIGKGLANGMPLSALVGKADPMSVLERVGYGLTYRGESLSLAAARACLGIYAETDVPAQLERTGARIRAAFDEAAARVGVVGGLYGPEARMSFAFSPAGGITSIGLQTLFVQECLKHGVLTNGNLLPSQAHDDAALEQSTQAFALALEVLARAIRERDLARMPPHPGARDLLRGRPPDRGRGVLKEDLVDYDPTTGRMRSTPAQVFLEVTSRCNLACVHCSRDFGRDEGHPGQDMALEVVERLRPWLRSARFVNLNGVGEPLIAPHFGTILDLCSGGDAKVSFNTNGLPLTDRTIGRIIDAGCYSVVVSLDGWESNEPIRGVSYEASRRAILALDAEKRRRGSSLPRIGLAYTLMRRNLHELPRVLADILPVAHIESVHVQPLIIFYETLREENIYRQVEVDEIVKRCEELAVANGAYFRLFRSSFERDEGCETNDLEEVQVGQKSERHGCIDPFYEVKIRSTGAVMSCSMGRMSGGDVLAVDDLDELWNSAWYRRLRMDLHAGRFEGRCRGCPYVFGSEAAQEDPLRVGVEHSAAARFRRGGYGRPPERRREATVVAGSFAEPVRQQLEDDLYDGRLGETPPGLERLPVQALPADRLRAVEAVLARLERLPLHLTGHGSVGEELLGLLEQVPYYDHVHGRRRAEEGAEWAALTRRTLQGGIPFWLDREAYLQELRDQGRGPQADAERILIEPGYRWFLDTVAAKGGRVLMLACGFGGVPLDLARRGLEVWGVDDNPEAIEMARQMLVDHPGLRIHYESQDLEDLELPHGYFDTACIWQTFHHHEGSRRVLEEVRRSLRPGGHVVFQDFCGEEGESRLLQRLTSPRRLRVAKRLSGVLDRLPGFSGRRSARRELEAAGPDAPGHVARRWFQRRYPLRDGDRHPRPISPVERVTGREALSAARELFETVELRTERGLVDFGHVYGLIHRVMESGLPPRHQRWLYRALLRIDRYLTKRGRLAGREYFFVGRKPERGGSEQGRRVYPLVDVERQASLQRLFRKVEEAWPGLEDPASEALAALLEVARVLDLGPECTDAELTRILEARFAARYLPDGIDLSTDDRRVLLHGFHQAAPEDGCRWFSGEAGFLAFVAPGDAVLAVECLRGWGPEEAMGLPVTLHQGGRRVGTQVLTFRPEQAGDEVVVLGFALPAGVVGLQVFELSAPSFEPDAVSGNGDRRRLSFRIKRISVGPSRRGHP
ncbi:MAG: aminotransferase class III-fold pyridoxal phosphate-dependent enzyme [Planctomycetota bacterium]